MPQDQPEAPDAMTALWIVDGIEGRQARVELEDGHTEDISLASLPRGVQEGDVLRVHLEGGDFTLEIDHALTRQRRAGAQAQLGALNRPAPAGELDL